MDRPFPFREVWLVRFLRRRQTGGSLWPVCCAALEALTGRLASAWLWGGRPACPYALGKDALFVSFDAVGELRCHLAMGWPAPSRVLDLGTEFKWLTNGRETPCGRDFIGALCFHNLDALAGVVHPDREKVLNRGAPYDPAERDGLLCASEEDAARLGLLWEAMLPHIDLPRAVLRGRFALAAAHMEEAGLPVDAAGLQLLDDNRDATVRRLSADGDPEGWAFAEGTFRVDRWRRYVEARGLPWPRARSGTLVFSGDAFRRMSAAHPKVQAVWGLRCLLDQVRQIEAPVGADGRVRYGTGAFDTVTGRCRPKAGECPLLWPAWARGFIQAPPGRALCSLDFDQQEWLVAAALSGDQILRADYEAGDCYLALGRAFGLVPPGATRKTHGRERDLCKALALATLYGQGEQGLALRIGRPVTVARDLLRRHRARYRRFWEWSNATVDFARCHGWLRTRFGWGVHVGPDTREPALRNWRVQAAAAEVLRLSACLLTEAGLAVCGTLHDAALVEADADAVEDAAGQAGRLMVRASADVLGVPLRVSARIVRHPERLVDDRCRATWEKVWRALSAASPAVRGRGPSVPTPPAGDTPPLPPAIPPSLLLSHLL